MGAELVEEQMTGGDVEGYSSEKNYASVGGKRRKGRRRTRKGKKMKKGHKGTRKGKKGHKGTRKGKKGHKGTRKGKKGPSKWIMHVKAFCKKTGKTFPEALKDPMCKKTFKH